MNRTKPLLRPSSTSPIVCQTARHRLGLDVTAFNDHLATCADSARPDGSPGGERR